MNTVSDRMNDVKSSGYHYTCFYTKSLKCYNAPHDMEQKLQWESVNVSNKMFSFLATKSATTLVKTLSSVAPEEPS